MERHSMLMDGENQYSKNDFPPQSNKSNIIPIKTLTIYFKKNRAKIFFIELYKALYGKINPEEKRNGIVSWHFAVERS